MSKRTIFFILGLLWSNWTNAQETFILNGMMGVQGGEIFYYKLELKDSTNNLMTGYAYTFYEQNKDVKAAVIAKIDRKNKTLQITEQNIIYNKGFTSKVLICLVVSELAYNESKINLTGKITTRTAGKGGLPCSTGSISFTNKPEIDRIFAIKENNNADTVKKVQKVVKKPVVYAKDTIVKKKVEEPKPQVTTPKPPEKITQGQLKEIQWYSDKIIVEVWDGTTIDYDKISIHYNGEVIIKNYTLTKEKYKLILPIKEGEMGTIVVVAENEGNESPNTANLTLYDGEIAHQIIAHNKAGKKSEIKIKRINQ